MIVASTGLAVNEWIVVKETLRALIMFMTLFTTTLAPNFLVGTYVIIDCNLVFLVFICLLYYSFYHCLTFSEIIISVSSNENKYGFIFISLVFIIDFVLFWLKYFWLKHYFVLGTFSSDLNLALAFSFQLLLSCTSRTNDLTDVVYWRIFWVWDDYSPWSLGRLIVRWSLYKVLWDVKATYLVCWVNLHDFIDELIPFP
jgi:hypothetical protein